MKTITAALMLLSLAAPLARAQRARGAPVGGRPTRTTPGTEPDTSRWVKFSTSVSDGALWYADVTTMTNLGGTNPTVWLQEQGGKIKPGHALFSRTEVDCPNHRLRILAGIERDQGGESVSTDNVPGSWFEIAPESVGEGIAKLVCPAPAPAP